MHKLILLAMTVSALAGCAAGRPGCDGSDRRPINVPVQAGLHYPSCGAAA